MYSAQAELHARSGKKIAMCRKASFLILESRFQNSIRDCRLFCPVCRCGSSIESPSSKASRPWKSIFAVNLCSGKAETIFSKHPETLMFRLFFGRTVGFTFTASTVEIETRSWPGTCCFVLLMDKTLHKYQFDLFWYHEHPSNYDDLTWFNIPIRISYII